MIISENRFPLFRIMLFPDHAPGRDRGHQQRDQDVIAGQRQAQKAPLHFVAADDLLGIEARQQVTSAAEISNRPGAIGRSLPKSPFDAGMIGAEHGIAERQGSKKHQPRNQHPAWGIPGGGERDQRAERDRQVIGIALFEAERTGADIQHQLKVPGARQRRSRNSRDRQRHRQRGVGGAARMRLAGGGVKCHIDLPYPEASYPARPVLSRRARSHWSVFGSVFGSVLAVRRPGRTLQYAG